MALTLANKITVGRILLVPVLVVLLMYYTPERDYVRWWGLAVFLLAEATDAVDGYVARRYYQKTKAGSILDPLADKLLLISIFITLFVLGERFLWPVRFPLWLVAAFVARDVILVLGGLLLELKSSLKEIKPSVLGKATSVFQAICVVIVLMQLDYLQCFYWLAVVAAVVSGVIYMTEGIKVLNNGHG